MKKLFVLTPILAGLVFVLHQSNDVQRATNKDADTVTADTAADVVESRKRTIVTEVDLPDAALIDVGVPADVEARTSSMLEPVNIEVPDTEFEVPVSDNEIDAVDPAAKMSPALVAAVRYGSSEMVDVIIRYDDHPQLFEENRIEDLGGEILRRYESLKMRAVRLPVDAVEALAI
nr:hypothetical protein [Woeseiaceae bacterium]